MLIESPKRFREALKREAEDRGISDLVQKITLIEKNLRDSRLWKEFQKDPYQRDQNGRLVFYMGEDGEEPNLLEDFTVRDIEELVDYPIIKKGEQDIRKVESLPGKILVVPDTNVLLSPLQLQQLKSDPSYEVDLFTIVREEAKCGNGSVRGLGRYKGRIPETLARGVDSIGKRIVLQPRGYQEEVKAFYNCIFDYFSQAMNRLGATLQEHPGWSNQRIAETVAKHDYEREMFAKQVEKLRGGNSWNTIADRLLVAGSYAINMASSDNLAVIVSEDSDLGAISQMMHDEIIPLYMARGAFEILPGIQGKIRRTISSPESLIPVAKQHLITSETTWSSRENYLHSAGIIYNPRTDKFTLSPLPQAYVSYMHNLGSYRSGKQTLIAVAGLLGVTPQKALDVLLGETAKV